MSRNSRSQKRKREESSDEYDLNTKRLRVLPPENRIVLSKLNENRSSEILDFFAFGANDENQLGEGSNSEGNLVTLSAVSDLNSLGFACGRNSSFVVEANHQSKSRNVYTWGGDLEVLGREQDGQVSPVEALEGQAIVQIAAGTSHALALTVTGEVLSWGVYKDRKGQLIGFRPSMGMDEWQEYPDVVQELEEFKVTQVAASASRSVALTETGEVYEWGETRLDNRTVDRHRQDTLLPTQVLIPGGKIVAVYAEGSGSAVFAENSSGVVFAWGNNNFYQCGIDAEVVPSKKVKDPEVAKRNAEAKREKISTHSRPSKATQINNLMESLEDDSIKKISTGRLHTVLLTTNGEVYTWGNNKFGQLGQGIKPSEKATATPGKVEFPGLKGEIIDVASGPFHTLAVSSTGQVFGFGANKHHCLANAKDIQNTPVVLKLSSSDLRGKIVKVACGSKHNLVAATTN